MIPPYYYKFSMDEIMGYYEDVIAAIPDLPTIIYNIPQFTGVEFGKDNAGRLLANENIVGIKHTSTNLYSLERMGQAFPGKHLINGFDEQLRPPSAPPSTSSPPCSARQSRPLPPETWRLPCAGSGPSTCGWRPR